MKPIDYKTTKLSQKNYNKITICHVKLPELSKYFIIRFNLLGCTEYLLQLWSHPTSKKIRRKLGSSFLVFFCFSYPFPQRGNFKKCLSRYTCTKQIISTVDILLVLVIPSRSMLFHYLFENSLQITVIYFLALRKPLHTTALQECKSR